MIVIARGLSPDVAISYRFRPNNNNESAAKGNM